MSDTKNPTKPDRDDMQVKQQIFHNLLEISELYPKFPIAQHLAAIMRKKDETGNGKEAFHWDNKELLKRVQQHKKELEGEDFMNEVETDY
jgi:hypothetical protein